MRNLEITDTRRGIADSHARLFVGIVLERGDKQGFVRVSLIRCGDGQIIRLTPHEHRQLIAAAPGEINFDTMVGWDREFHYLATETEVLLSVAQRLQPGEFELGASGTR